MRMLCRCLEPHRSRPQLCLKASLGNHPASSAVTFNGIFLRQNHAAAVRVHPHFSSSCRGPPAPECNHRLYRRPRIRRRRRLRRHGVPHPESRPHGSRGRALHGLLCRRAGLHAIAGGTAYRQPSGAGRPRTPCIVSLLENRAAYGRNYSSGIAQATRLLHRHDRQMASRAP